MARPSSPTSLSPNSSAPPPAEPQDRNSANQQHPFRPKLTFAELETRRPSVQFAAPNDWGLRAANAKPHPSQPLRRMSSPPPPSTYENRVSFNTFDNRDATDFSFSLASKHKNYSYSSRSRTFLCGTDQNDYSEFALEWLLDELVEDGDEIVCLRVVDKDSKINSDASVQQGRYKVEARKLLEHIQEKNQQDAKCISLILEYALGKVPETIQRMITIYSPACLIVGTRGRSLGGFQGLLPGSVSKYCLQNSPVPVVVVRPSNKREKKKQKRREDPRRQSYRSILEQSGADGSQMLDKGEGDKMVRHPGGEASENEADAVARAIGAFTEYQKKPSGQDGEETLSRVASSKSNYTSGPDSPGPTGRLSPDEPTPGDSITPEFAALNTPEMSEEEDEGNEAVDEDVDEEADDERRVRKKAPILKARKMEAGEGKYLKPDSSITDDT